MQTGLTFVQRLSIQVRFERRPDSGVAPTARIDHHA
jgi:hypothetical protein